MTGPVDDVRRDDEATGTIRAVTIVRLAVLTRDVGDRATRALGCVT